MPVNELGLYRSICVVAVFAAAALSGFSLCWLLVWTRGTNFTASVTRASQDQRKYKKIYTVDIQYSVGGKQYATSHAVSAATYARVTRPGAWAGGLATVKVRHLDLGPRHFHLLVEEGVTSREGLIYLLVTPPFDLAICYFIYRAWIMRIQRQRLLQDGEVAAGEIINSRMQRGGGAYFVTFRFTPRGTGADIEVEMEVFHRAHFFAAQRARHVTVLYNLHHPRHAVVYELSGYSIVGAQAA